MSAESHDGLIAFGIIILLLLGWGYIGGLEAKSIGITCDIGFENSLCWKWHTNVLGEAQKAFFDALEKNR